MCVCVCVCVCVRACLILVVFWSTVKARSFFFFRVLVVFPARRRDVYLNTMLSWIAPESELFFAERCLSLCCVRKQGCESASADWCHVKSPAPCSPLLHLSARLASPRAPYLPFPFFFFLSLQLLPKTPPVVFISLVLLVTLPLPTFSFLSRPTVRNHYRPTSLSL